MSELDDVIEELEVTQEHAALTASKLSKKIIAYAELEAERDAAFNAGLDAAAELVEKYAEWKLVNAIRALKEEKT